MSLKRRFSTIHTKQHQPEIAQHTLVSSYPIPKKQDNMSVCLKKEQGDIEQTENSKQSYPPTYISITSFPATQMTSSL